MSNTNRHQDYLMQIVSAGYGFDIQEIQNAITKTNCKSVEAAVEYLFKNEMQPQLNNEDTTGNDDKKIKRTSNELIVDDVSEVVQGDGDNSCVLLSVAKMEELGLFRGDEVLIKGKARHSTVCIVLANENTDDGKIRMNGVIRKNLHVKLGDVVSIRNVHETVKWGKRIHILPFKDSVDGITGSLFDTYLKPYFQDSYRPVMVGDCFLVRGDSRSVEFKVIEVEVKDEWGQDSCIVAPETIIHCNGDPITREDDIDELTLIEQYKDEMKEKDAMIDELNKKLSELNVMKEEEKKMDDDNVGIEKILSDLDNEFNAFKQEYNGDKLQQIFDETPQHLVNKESSLNKQFTKYKENVDKIVVSSKSFNKYIQDIDNMINKLSKPDPTKYKSWNIKQILIWIQGLENGRFNKHINKLKHGLEKSEITGEDLPDLTRGDLSLPPFEIGNFRDKKQLEMHFQSLKTPQSLDEGAPTAYL